MKFSQFTFLKLFIPALVFTACMPDWDENKLNDIKYQANWAAPVFKTEIGIEQLVLEDSNFTVDPDGGIRIIYELDSLAAFGIGEFAEIPSQSPTHFDLLLDIPSVDVGTSMGTLAGAQFYSVQLDSGRISLHFDNATAYSPEILIVFNNGILNGSVFTISHIIPPGISDQSFDMSGLLLDLSNNNTTSNYLNISFDVVDNDGAPAGTIVSTDMNFEGLKVNAATGYFGDRLINIPSGSFKLGLSGIEKFINGLYLDNPTIDLVVASNIGIPLGLNLDFDGINSAGNLEPLTLTPYVINAPTAPGTFDTTHLIIDKNNSNISDFIANVPSNILYSGILKMNPAGQTQNFITSDARVSMGLKLDLPLELRTQNLVFEQVINDLNLNIGEDQSQPVDAVTLKFKVDNGFPLDAAMKVIFIDKTTQLESDSLSFNLFESAPVDASGRVTNSKVSTEEVTLSGTKVEHLLNADKVKIILTLNTYNMGTQTVKIFSDYSATVQMAAAVNVNFQP